MHTRKHSGVLGSLLLLMTISLTVAGRLGAQVATSPPASPSIAAVPGLTAALGSKVPLGPSALAGPLVATNTTANMANKSTGTDTSFNFQSMHVTTADVTAFKLTWLNNTSHSITMTAAIWLPSSSLSASKSLQVTWNGGATSVVVPFAATSTGAATVTSDWIVVPSGYQVSGFTYQVRTGTDSGPFNTTSTRTVTATSQNGMANGYVPAGTPFYVREYVTCTAAGCPLGLVTGLNRGEGSSHGTAEVDETLLTNSQLTSLSPVYAAGNVTGGWNNANPPDQAGYLYCPSAIQGQTTSSPAYSVGIYGDSIANGTGDQWVSGQWQGANNNYTSTNQTTSGAGALVRAFDQLGVPVCQTAVYGDSFGFGSADDWYRYPFFSVCSHVILEMGINSIRSLSDGAANANVTANTTTIVNRLTQVIASVKRRNQSVKCILWTYPPATASDGKTASGTGQATRISINDYIRANYAAMGAVDYIDAANAVEATAATQGTLAQDGGSWWSGPNGLVTIDGVHPNNYGHGFIAAAIVAKVNAGMLAK